MSRTQIFGTLGGVLALAILLIPTPTAGPPLPPENNVAVDKSFDDLERLWLKHNQDAADKIDSGELTTQQQVWDFIATGQEPMRKVAFGEIGKSEKKYFDDNGGWTAELHSKLLRSYK